MFAQCEAYNETLSYALALRQQNHSIPLMKGSVPSLEVVSSILSKALDEEYGDDVSCSYCNCAIVSEEEMPGIVIRFAEYPQLAMVMYMFKLGKKLTVKLYTTFVPATKDSKEHVKQALSMYENRNPMMSAWEDSVSETVLMCLQQVLNKENTKVKKKNSDIVEF